MKPLVGILQVVMSPAVLQAHAPNPGKKPLYRGLANLRAEDLPLLCVLFMIRGALERLVTIILRR